MKRVLIINSISVNDACATGITLRSFLSKFPTNTFMEICWCASDCKQYWKINTYKLHYRRFSLANYFEKKRNSAINVKVKQQENNKGKKSIFTFIRQWISLSLDRSPVILTKDIEKKIKDFNPEVIYTLGASLNALKLSYKVSERFDIPIVIHYMDNWVHCLQWENNPFLTRYKKELRKYARKCQLRSDYDIAISPRMAEVYTNEFGKRHANIMNSINTTSYFCCSATQKREPIRFVYAGGLHLGRNQALFSIASAVERASLKLERNIELCIYTSEQNKNLYQSQFAGFSRTIFCSFVPHNQIKKVYEDADVLVHIESGELAQNDFFRYSISTKIPEYLSTGKTILFFGPDDIYLYDFLKQNAMAYTVKDDTELLEAVERIVEGNQQGKLYSQNAVKYARSNFDVTVAQERFLTVMNTVSLLK